MVISNKDHQGVKCLLLWLLSLLPPFEFRQQLRDCLVHQEKLQSLSPCRRSLSGIHALRLPGSVLLTFYTNYSACNHMAFVQKKQMLEVLINDSVTSKCLSMHGYSYDLGPWRKKKHTYIKLTDCKVPSKQEGPQVDLKHFTACYFLHNQSTSS